MSAYVEVRIEIADWSHWDSLGMCNGGR